MPPARSNERGRFLSVVGKLKEGVTETTQARSCARSKRLSDEVPQFNKNYSVEVPLREQFFGNVRRPLWLMLGAVGFVLLIVRANVANLLLSLATSREGDRGARHWARDAHESSGSC